MGGLDHNKDVPKTPEDEDTKTDETSETGGAAEETVEETAGETAEETAEESNPD